MSPVSPVFLFFRLISNMLFEHIHPFYTYKHFLTLTLGSSVVVQELVKVSPQNEVNHTWSLSTTNRGQTLGTHWLWPTDPLLVFWGNGSCLVYILCMWRVFSAWKYLPRVPDYRLAPFCRNKTCSPILCTTIEWCV